MYQPAHSQFVEDRPDVLHRLIRENPLGTLITQREDAIAINHLPFLLNEAGNKFTAHVPRANPVWQGLDGKSVQIVFHGPNAYISPSWYAAKQEHGRVVPTWNYAVVHAQGTVRVIEDRSWLRAYLDELTDTHERELAHPWHVSDAPSDYIDKLLGSIVGLEIAIAKLEGKYKLGQNRSQADRQGVMDGLTALDSPLAAFARKFGL